MSRRSVLLASSSALVLFAALACMMSTPSAANMPGGKTAADPNSAEVSQAAEIAVALLNNGDAHKLQGTQLSGPLVLTKIKTVTTQVVAGIMYEITIGVKDVSNVEKDLVVKVWSCPWLVAKNDASNPAWQLTSVKPATSTD